MEKLKVSKFYILQSYKLSKDQYNKVQHILGGHQDIWHQVSQSDLTNMKETLLWLADMIKHPFLKIVILWYPCLLVSCY